jgi:hypothetical protein
MGVPVDVLLTAVDNKDNDVKLQAAGAGEMRIIPPLTIGRHVVTGSCRWLKGLCSTTYQHLSSLTIFTHFFNPHLNLSWLLQSLYLAVSNKPLISSSSLTGPRSE